MRAGDIVFFKPSDWLGRMIAKVDGGPYSHVAIAVSDTHVAEAQGLRFSRITPLYGRDHDIIDIGLSEEQRRQITMNAPLIVGRWYDYKLIAGYFLRNVFKWNVDALWNSQMNLICSELVSSLLVSVGHEGANELTGHNVSPSELYVELYFQKEKT